MSKERRDARFRELKAQGKNVARRTTTNARLHPMYVTDYTEETGIELSKEDKGFGNTIYQTFFVKLYIIEEEY